MLMFCHISSSWSPCQIHACFTKIKKIFFLFAQQTQKQKQKKIKNKN